MRHRLLKQAVWLAVGLSVGLYGCAVPANVAVDKAIECTKSHQKITYNYRLFDGAITHMICE